MHPLFCWPQLTEHQMEETHLTLHYISFFFDDHWVICQTHHSHGVHRLSLKANFIYECFVDCYIYLDIRIISHIPLYHVIWVTVLVSWSFWLPTWFLAIRLAIWLTTGGPKTNQKLHGLHSAPLCCGFSVQARVLVVIMPVFSVSELLPGNDPSYKWKGRFVQLQTETGNSWKINHKTEKLQAFTPIVQECHPQIPN